MKTITLNKKSDTLEEGLTRMLERFMSERETLSNMCKCVGKDEFTHVCIDGDGSVWLTYDKPQLQDPTNKDDYLVEWIDHDNSMERVEYIDNYIEDSVKIVASESVWKVEGIINEK